MAEVVENFDFSGAKKASKYPWEEWTNGKIWKIVKGIDFDNKVESFIQTLRQRASDCGMRVQVAAQGTEVIYFNFLPKERTEKEKLVESIKNNAEQLATYLLDYEDSSVPELITIFNILKR